MGHTSWDCTVLPGQEAENRIALMGNSRKELAGLPDRQPRRVNTRYGLIPVAASATKFAGDETGLSVAVSGARHLWFRFNAPTSTSVTTQQSITVTVTAAAG